MSLNDKLDMQDIPKSEVLDGDITEVNEATRSENMPLPEDQDSYKYGEPSDPTVQIVVEYEYKGSVGSVSNTYNVPEDGEDVHPRSKLGRFKRQYGKFPEEGMDVTVSFDESGIGDVVIAEE